MHVEAFRTIRVKSSILKDLDPYPRTSRRRSTTSSTAKSRSRALARAVADQMVISSISRNRIIRQSERLLGTSRLPPMAFASNIVNEQTWVLLTQIDDAQALLAGSTTWEDPQALRRAGEVAATLSFDAAAIGLAEMSNRLAELSSSLKAVAG